MGTKTVLITGCSSGFGRLIADLFFENGWTVLATLRNSARIKDQPNDPRFRVLELDVTKSEDRAAVAHYIETQFDGKLDCLINNAGYGLFGSLEETSESELRQQFEVNFFGLAFLSQALLPSLRAAKGKIINLSSVCGAHGMPLTSSYCASKFAVEGLTESLRYELAPHGVQVGMIEPGGFRTKFGANVQWSARSNEADTLYAVQNSNYRRLLAKLRAGKGKPAITVARTAYWMATTPRMPLRVQVGKDARATHWARRLLPAFLWTRLSETMYRAVFNRPVSSAALGERNL